MPFGAKPQSVDGAHAGSGEGYRVMTKSGGGTQLLVQFTPPEGFRIDGRLVYKDDLVRDSYDVYAVDADAGWYVVEERSPSGGTCAAVKGPDYTLFLPRESGDERERN